MTLLLLAAAASLAWQTSPVAPDCQAEQLGLTIVRDSDGLNSAARLVVRNAGPTGCSLPGLPILHFVDDHGRTLPISRQVPPGMHPGPVVLPVRVEAGGTATAELRWVSGDAHGGSTCLDAASLSLTVGRDESALMTSFEGRFCAPGGTRVTFTQSWFRLDPASRPSLRQ